MNLNATTRIAADALRDAGHMSARSRKGPAEPSWLTSDCQRQPDELYLMCDDIHATLAELRAKGVEAASDVSDQGCGLLAAIRLPDGAEFPLYQPGPSPLQL